jgi:hypothetical protein
MSPSQLVIAADYSASNYVLASFSSAMIVGRSSYKVAVTCSKRDSLIFRSFSIYFLSNSTVTLGALLSARMTESSHFPVLSFPTLPFPTFSWTYLRLLTISAIGALTLLHNFYCSECIPHLPVRLWHINLKHRSATPQLTASSAQ